MSITKSDPLKGRILEGCLVGITPSPHKGVRLLVLGGERATPLLFRRSSASRSARLASLPPVRSPSTNKNTVRKSEQYFWGRLCEAFRTADWERTKIELTNLSLIC
jgi:hypothetical protein